jgi:APA family basic amino acid/polyamine antiporter
MNLFATKSLATIQAEAGNDAHGLKKTLGPVQLVALGVGAIIGAGLFSLTGIAAANNAGPAITLSFVLAAIGCAFAGLCYSEFSTMIPIAGSAYTYSYATMGELLAWVIGWDLVLEYAVGASTVAVSWSGYLRSLLLDWGIDLDPRWMNSPFTTITLTGGQKVHGLVNLPAIFIVVCVSTLLIIGIQESARVNAVIVALKVAVVILFILFGWAYIQTRNYHPYIPPNTGQFGHFGWSGILRGAGVVFFAFIGFDAVSTAAQEARNPQKHMPIGIIGSLVLCTVLYVLFAHTLTGIVPFSELNTEAPVAVAVNHTGLYWLMTAIKLAILAGYTSVILVMLLGQSRVFYSMSNDGLLPKLFSDIHPRFRTPYRSNLLFMCFVGFFAAFAPIQIVGEMTSIGTLFAFVLVCAGILVMRKTHPDLHRPFRTPLVPLVPILGILSCLALMFGLGLSNWLRLFIWMALGMIVYFSYGRHHSHLNRPIP